MISCSGRRARAGDMPSRSAATMIGVPCSSVPLTISTSLPFRRW